MSDLGSRRSHFRFRTITQTSSRFHFACLKFLAVKLLVPATASRCPGAEARSLPGAHFESGRSATQIQRNGRAFSPQNRRQTTRGSESVPFAATGRPTGAWAGSQVEMIAESALTYAWQASPLPVWNRTLLTGRDTREQRAPLDPRDQHPNCLPLSGIVEADIPATGAAGKDSSPPKI